MCAQHILSLDGGGIKGYLSILLLERLDRERPGFVKIFDLLAGTSTGSLIALGLAAGYSPTAIRRLYESECKVIFHDSLWDNVRDVGFMFGAQYGREGINKTVVEFFRDLRLGDLQQKVLVASFDLDAQPRQSGRPRMWKAKFFHNYDEPGSDVCEFVADVALRSSAAPFYFPSYQGYVDGFVIANNPSMCALAQVLQSQRVAPADVRLLSVGTGLSPRHVDDKDTDWGWLKWLFQMRPLRPRSAVLPLIYMMWEGGIDLANYQCAQLLDDRFFRLDPVLCRPVDIDAVKDMPYLRDAAMAADLDPVLDWLDAYVLDQVAAAAPNGQKPAVVKGG